MKITSTLLAAAMVLPVPAMAADCGLPGWFLSGTNPDGYICGSETDGGVESVFIKAKTDTATGFATVMQMVGADHYRGQRLRLSAQIKTAAAGNTQLWMRVDGAGNNVLAFYNMDDRPVTGSTGWAPYSVVLDVPDQAQAIAFGYLFNSKGEAWAKDFALTVVGKDVPVSLMPAPAPPKVPANLSFDQ